MAPALMFNPLLDKVPSRETADGEKIPIAPVTMVFEPVRKCTEPDCKI